MVSRGQGEGLREGRVVARVDDVDFGHLQPGLRLPVDAGHVVVHLLVLFARRHAAVAVAAAAAAAAAAAQSAVGQRGRVAGFEGEVFQRPRRQGSVAVLGQVNGLLLLLLPPVVLVLALVVAILVQTGTLAEVECGGEDRGQRALGRREARRHAVTGQQRAGALSPQGHDGVGRLPRLPQRHDGVDGLAARPGEHTARPARQAAWGVHLLTAGGRGSLAD